MENFFTSSEPFFLLARSMGFIPYSFDGLSRKGNLKITKLNILQVFIAMSILFFVAIANFIHYRFYLRGMDFFEYSIWSWLLMFSYPLIFFQFIFQMFKMKDIKKLCNSIDECDRKLNILYLKVDHKKHRKFIKYLTLIVICLPSLNYAQTMIFCQYFNILSSDTLIQEFFYSIHLIFENFIFAQFIVLVYHVRERFLLLSKALK